MKSKHREIHSNQIDAYLVTQQQAAARPSRLTGFALSSSHCRSVNVLKQQPLVSTGRCFFSFYCFIGFNPHFSDDEIQNTRRARFVIRYAEWNGVLSCAELWRAAQRLWWWSKHDWNVNGMLMQTELYWNKMVEMPLYEKRTATTRQMASTRGGWQQLGDTTSLLFARYGMSRLIPF